MGLMQERWGLKALLEAGVVTSVWHVVLCVGHAVLCVGHVVLCVGHVVLCSAYTSYRIQLSITTSVAICFDAPLSILYILYLHIHSKAISHKIYILFYYLIKYIIMIASYSGLINASRSVALFRRR